MQIAMPGPDDKDPRDEIYRKVVDALPDDARTADVVTTLAMVLSAVLIAHGKDKERRLKVAQHLCDKIMEACKTCPSHAEIAADPDKYQNTSYTRH